MLLYVLEDDKVPIFRFSVRGRNAARLHLGISYASYATFTCLPEKVSLNFIKCIL